MRAHYGYMDGSGEFFITVETGSCVTCDDKPCIKSCPRHILAASEDDYGRAVMEVSESARRKLRNECAGCKPNLDRPPLPCIAACPFDAITHSW